MEGNSWSRKDKCHAVVIDQVDDEEAGGNEATFAFTRALFGGDTSGRVG